MIRVFMVGMSTDKGGVEAYISNLSGFLSDEKYEIVYSWPVMEVNGKTWVCPRNRHNYYKYAKFWKRFFKENHFDVVYYNTCDIVSVDMLKFAKKAGVPVRIIHSHSTENQIKMNMFHRITEKRNRKNIEKIATNLLACSEDAGYWMFPGKKFNVIKNGIDYSKYRYQLKNRTECRKSISVADGYLIGCIGRLDPPKNPLMSVEIMKEISKLNATAKFVFVGDGELRPQVEQKIKEYNLEDRIVLLGARDDANKWYSAIDCLIMPSLFEGLPFTLVEAQAAGLSCVVSNTVSGDANITGLIEYVDLNQSTKVWADHILEACDKERLDTKEQLKKAGYSIQDTAQQVDKIIQTSLEKSVQWERVN